MLEFLMGYVDKIQEDFEQMGANQVHKNAHMLDCRYETLMDMKKFILEDLTYHFIDQDIKALLEMQQPTKDLITITMKRWEEFCEKYPDYLNKDEIKDYIFRQMIQEE